MASWLPQPNRPAATLNEQLDQVRPIRRAGDEFGSGGWHHQSDTIAPPDLPSVYLVLLPFLVLLIVAVAIVIGLLYAEGRL